MSKLYPPYINGTIPAFYKAYDAQDISETEGTVITVPFTMNNAVGISSVEGFALRIKTVQSGLYLCAPIYTQSYDIEKNEVYFTVPLAVAQELNEGQYYKLQIAYYQNEPTEANTGYYSTVGVTKCVSKPIVYINGFDSSSINLFSNEYLGVYDISEGRDQSEKVYSYCFDFYDSNDDLVYTSGELIHNSSNDTDYSYSIDNITINDFMEDDKVYSVKYTITTMNGLVVSTPRYQITTEYFIAPSRDLEIIPTVDFENGFVYITFKGQTETVQTEEIKEYKLQDGKRVPVYETEDREYTYNGQFLVTRACEDDNYSTWSEISRFRLDNERPSTVSMRDFTIQQGYKYKYAIQQYNIFGIYSSRITTTEVSADFEDAFLYDGEKYLKIRFNPTMNSFKTEITEKKVDTIGSQYPFIFRNGKGNYKTFPIGGLLSFQLDEEQMFLKREVIDGERWEMTGSEPYNPTRYENLSSDTDPSMKNFFKERLFKLAVLDWLNNGKPKLFKSPSEGNYIVRLMKVSLKPETKLGRMIHTFTSTAYEMAEASYDNLLKYGFVAVPKLPESVPLWKIYDLEKGYEKDKDISLPFEGKLISFQAEGMTPGDKIEIYSTGNTKTTIVIGATGSFRYENDDDLVSKLVIPAIKGRKQLGTISCYFKDSRITEFDMITDIKLVTYIDKQFIGVDPQLADVHQFDNANSISSTMWKALQKTNVRNWLGKTNTDEARQLDDDARTAIQNYVYGDIISQIQTTLYKGQMEKIQLRDIEQADFRLRELIPVYSYNPKKIKGTNGYYLWDARRPSSYATTPFGKPEPLRELSTHELQDPYCIYEAFEWMPANTYFVADTWDPNQVYWRYRKDGTFEIYNVEDSGAGIGNVIDGHFSSEEAYKNALSTGELTDRPYTRTESDGWHQPYYTSNLDDSGFLGDGKYFDCYWNYWTDKYDPTFYVEDKYNYVRVVGRIEDDSTGKISTFCDFKQDKETKKWYYMSGGQKIDYDYTNLYIYEGLEYQYVGDNFKITPPTNGNYYIRIPNEINLMEVKHKHLTHLGSPSVLRIGNGVMLDATFQIKVIDYYTEQSNSEVRNAKDAYLNKAQLLENIAAVYVALKQADKAWQKYRALKNTYSVILTGKWDTSNGTIKPAPSSFYMIESDAQQIELLLRDLDTLNLMEGKEEIELQEIHEACATIDQTTQVEGLQDKLSQLLLVINNLIAEIEDLEKKAKEEEETFEAYKKAVDEAQDTYNITVRMYRIYSWMAQLFSTIDDDDTTARQEIIDHYRSLTTELSNTVENNRNNLASLADYCDTFYAQIKEILSRIIIYFEVQTDGDEDKELDDYIDDMIGGLLVDSFIYDQELRILDEYLQPQSDKLFAYVFKNKPYTETAECEQILAYLTSDLPRTMELIALGVSDKFKIAENKKMLIVGDKNSTEYKNKVMDFCLAVDDLYGLSLVHKRFWIATSWWSDERYEALYNLSEQYRKEMSYTELTNFGAKRKMVAIDKNVIDVGESETIQRDLFFLEGKYDSALDWDFAHCQVKDDESWITLSLAEQEELLTTLKSLNDFLALIESYFSITRTPTDYLLIPDEAIKGGRLDPINSDIPYTLKRDTRFLNGLYSLKMIYLSEQELNAAIKDFNEYIKSRYDILSTEHQEELYKLIDSYPKLNEYNPTDRTQAPQLPELVPLEITITRDVANINTPVADLPASSFSITFDGKEPYSAQNTLISEQPKDVRGYFIDEGLYNYFGVELREGTPATLKQYGVIYWYITLEIEKTLDMLKEQYRQAAALQGDYTSRINNYTTKLEKYTQEYTSNVKAYNSYAGTEEMAFYENNFTKVSPETGRITGVIYYINTDKGEYIPYTDEDGITTWFETSGAEFIPGTNNGKDKNKWLYMKTNEYLEKLASLRAQVMNLWYEFINCLDTNYSYEKDRGIYTL